MKLRIFTFDAVQVHHFISELMFYFCCKAAAEIKPPINEEWSKGENGWERKENLYISL